MPVSDKSIIGLGGGAGLVDACRIGFIDYNDLNTQTTPIVVTGGGGLTLITNDGLGPFTNRLYLPTGVNDVWDTSLNQFDFSDLKLGDMMDIRIDMEVTTSSPNQSLTLALELGTGGGAYSIPFVDTSFKTAAIHPVDWFNGIYMGDANTLDNPGRFKVASDGDATVLVKGWYCKILIRG